MFVSKNTSLLGGVIKKVTLFMLLLATAVVIQLILAPKAHATTYNLSPSPAPGECNLNDAIEAINNQAVTGGCSAGTSSNTINFASGTHNLSAPPIVTFDGDLSINGVSATSSILDGNGLTGFSFNPSSGSYTLTLTNLTLQNFTNSDTGTVCKVLQCQISER